MQLDAYWFDESCLCNTCVVVTALRVSYSTGGSPKSFRFKSVSPWNISQWENLTNVKMLPLSGKQIRKELSMVQSVVSPSRDNKGKKNVHKKALQNEECSAQKTAFFSATSNQVMTFGIVHAIGYRLKGIEEHQ